VDALLAAGSLDGVAADGMAAGSCAYVLTAGAWTPAAFGEVVLIRDTISVRNAFYTQTQTIRKEL